MSYSIADIEGIGVTFKRKLQKVDVRTTAKLLERAATAKGRKELAAESGIDIKKILKWTNMADLMRIKGVGEEYSELLEAAGVDTVKELRNRRPDNLHAKMLEVNKKKKLVRLPPGLPKVEKWVAQAKELKPLMSY